MSTRVEGIRYGTAQGRWVLFATILGSGIAFLDSTVVNVALPAIGQEFDASIAGLQWTIESYLLTLGSLILLGGSLGDLYGRRRIFVYGLGLFTVASALCGIAPSVEFLIAARALQGVGAAMLVPGSLALIQSSFAPEDRGRAIGAWSGLSGVSTAIGPFLGGWMIDNLNWRYVFFINIPLALIVIFVSRVHVPEVRNPDARHPDIRGAVAAIVGLGGVIYALVEGPAQGWGSPSILIAAGVGIAALAVFLATEARDDEPMLPLELFRSAQFSGANALTLMVYFSLGGGLFLLVLQLQRVMGYSALEAGVAFLPGSLLLMLLSSRTGALAQRIGPRSPLTVGPIVAGVGLAMMARVEPGTSYVEAVLPAAIVFGLGLAITVAPLTSSVLAAVETTHAGIASGVNNAVARIAGLLAVALLPFMAGISGADGLDPGVFNDGFRQAALIGGAICATGGVIGFATIRSARTETTHVPPSVDHPCQCEGETAAGGAQSAA